MDNYIKTMIHRMALLTGTILTKRHFDILEYTYSYYEKNKVGPLYLNLKKNTGATKEEIEKIFPHGLNSVYTWVNIPIHTPDQTCKPLVKVQVNNPRDIYLDYNATSYIRPEISDLLNRYINNKEGFANPSSSTIQGKRAYDHIYAARAKISNCLSVKPEEIIFTGGGSEANNLIIKGIAFKHFKEKGHIITSAVEHPSVYKPIQWLGQIGFETTILDVERDGIVSPHSIKKAIRKNTILVSIMAVNNEIGTINPIREIGMICKEHNIPFMVDAIQAFGKMDLKPAEWGISALTFSGHKIYAPKGVGGLYLSRDLIIEPLIHGGDQEFGLRSGTENVGFIIAMGEAGKLAFSERHKETARFIGLRDYFLKRLKEVEPGYIVNGSLENRIPWNLNIGFPGADTGALVLSLNAIGISVSAGSACSAGKIRTSHVLDAIKADTENYGSLRFSFGLKTTREDIEYLFTYLPAILKGLKEQDK